MDYASLASWLEGYKQAWEEGDPAQIKQLFSQDATYAETPFDEPIKGHGGIIDYWTGGAQDTQTNISFGYEVLAVEGNTGFAHWWAAFDRVPSGKHVELDGMFVLVFDEAGLCTSLREWWHRREDGR